MRNLDDPEWLAYERPLVAKAKAGNHPAYGSLYSAHMPTLLSIYTIMVRNPDTAEDIVADTFHIGWKDIASFFSPRSIFFWLRQIGVNRVRDLKRREKVAPAADEGWERLLAPIELDMEGMIDLPRLKAQVGSVLAQLIESHRRALTMLFVEQMSREECAAALGMTIGAFYTLLSRALDSFRTLWLEQSERAPSRS